MQVTERESSETQTAAALEEGGGGAKGRGRAVVGRGGRWRVGGRCATEGAELGVKELRVRCHVPHVTRAACSTVTYWAHEVVYIF